MKRYLIKQSENITLTLYQTVGLLHTEYSSTLTLNLLTTTIVAPPTNANK